MVEPRAIRLIGLCIGALCGALTGCADRGPAAERAASGGMTGCSRSRRRGSSSCATRSKNSTEGRTRPCSRISAPSRFTTSSACPSTWGCIGGPVGTAPPKKTGTRSSTSPTSTSWESRGPGASTSFRRLRLCPDSGLSVGALVSPTRIRPGIRREFNAKTQRCKGARKSIGSDFVSLCSWRLYALGAFVLLAPLRRDPSSLARQIPGRVSDRRCYFRSPQAARRRVARGEPGFWASSFVAMARPDAARPERQSAIARDASRSAESTPFG